MSKPTITSSDYLRASKRLGCEVAAIKAVADTESKGKGFYTSGFPVILFERHKFRKYTDGRYTKTHPHLSGPAGGYGAAGQNQVNKFNEAYALDPQAAMMSCSWGKFQIMGFNYAVCGFTSVGAFVDAMKESEGRHLDAFVEFIISEHLADELRRHDWKGFARTYNGAGYAENKYDTKMAAAYRRYSAQKGNFDLESEASSIASGNPAVSSPESASETEIDPPSVETPSMTQNAGTIINTAPTVPAADSPRDIELPAPAKDGATASAAKTTILGITVPLFIATIVEAIQGLVKDGYLDAKEIGSTVVKLIIDNQKYVLILIGAFVALLIIKKLLRQITLWISMITAAIPSWHTVTVAPADPAPAKAWYHFWRD